MVRNLVILSAMLGVKASAGVISMMALSVNTNAPATVSYSDVSADGYNMFTNEIINGIVHDTNVSVNAFGYNPWYSDADPLTGLSYASPLIPRLHRLVIGSKTFSTNTVGRSVAISCNTAQGKFFTAGMVTAQTNVIMRFGFRPGATNFSASGGLFDVVFHNGDGGSQATFQLNAAGASQSVNIEVNHPGTTHSTTIAVTKGDDYWCAFQQDCVARLARLEVRSATNDSLIGQVSIASFGSSSEKTPTIRIGQGEAGKSSGSNIIEHLTIQRTNCVAIFDP